MNINRKAFLDTIAWSELGPDIIRLSDNGYNVIVGSTPSKLILFNDYKEHPRSPQWIDFNRNGIKDPGERSDAAGRYQCMGRYWPFYKAQLNLPDFGPESQDKWALQLAKECKALDLIDAGRIEEAIIACKSRWASFPGAGYNQHEHKMDNLLTAYVQAGGTVV